LRVEKSQAGSGLLDMFSSGLCVFKLGWPEKTADFDDITDQRARNGYDILFFWVARMRCSASISRDKFRSRGVLALTSGTGSGEKM